MKISTTICFVLFILLFSCTFISSRRHLKEKLPRIKSGTWKRYFVQLGYTRSTKITPDDEELEKALTRVEILYRFKKRRRDWIGISRKFLELSRCGNKDVDDDSRRKRKYEWNPPWRIKSLTYGILKYSADLSTQQQDDIIARAFEIWRDAVPELYFTMAPNPVTADIKISFETGDHGCAQAFDGNGPIIAHAYYPEDGRIHFDDDEVFSSEPNSNIYLLDIAVHEIGHVMGLTHSFTIGSIMSPVEKLEHQNAKLHDEDINRMRSLYASDTASSPECEDTDPSLCAAFFSEKYCDDYPEEMEKICPKSCGFC